MRQTPSMIRLATVATGDAGGWRLWAAAVVLGLTSLVPLGSALGVDAVPISDAPPNLLRGVPPNLVLTLDDSGSMRNANSGTTGWPVPRYDASDTASLINRQYYDPALVYLPPLGADGASFPHAPFSAAPRDFFRDGFCKACGTKSLGGALAGASCAALCPTPEDRGCLLDLATRYAPVWRDDAAPCVLTAGGFYRGDYSLDPSLEALVASPPTNEEPANKDKTAEKLAQHCMNDPNVFPGLDCRAFYHRLKPDADLGVCTGTVWRATDTNREGWIQDCLERVEVGSATDLDPARVGSEALEARRSLLGGAGESDQVLAERNFANWYAYYRNRWFSLQTVISRAVAGLDPAVRVTYQPLVEGGLDPGSSFFQSQLLAPFGPFDEQRRQWFQDWLFARTAQSSTPLLASAVRVHNFAGTDEAYREDPQSAGGQANPVRACRNQFHLMFTDGGWSDSSKPASWLANNDGTAKDLPAGTGSLAERLGVSRYALNDSTQIYWDSNTGGLADLVFHSWITDLRPSDDDPVRTLIRDPVVPSGEDPAYVFWNPLNDPADWQHLTTFTLGLGLEGEVTYPSGAYGPGENIATDGFPGNWTAFPGPRPEDAQKVDDLWHAGINGRGGYSAAKDPDALLEGFRRVFATVSGAVHGEAAAGAPTFNTGGASTSRLILQATLNVADWTGDLRAYRVSGGPGVAPCPEANKARGELCENPATGYYWSLAASLDGDRGRARRVVSATASYAGDGVKTSSPITFGSSAWDSLTEDDQRALLGLTDPAAAIPANDSPEVQEAKAVMDFIAGSRAREGSGLRERKSLVGDIINAAPVVVGPPSRVFRDPAYQAFSALKKNRQTIAYVGANDGLLRGVNFDTGAEFFAYVPRPLFGRLSVLAEPGYGSDPPHGNFVDGPIAEGDAYFDGAWDSVVVGALGLGAQAVYAIRSPSILSGDSDLDASAIHLWDFTDRDDPDLGYVFGKPNIVRVLMSDDSIRWVAIFGNGYNSSEPDGARPAGCDDPAQDRGTTACARAVLYVVDIGTGRLVAKLDTGWGRKDDPRDPGDPGAREPNGLSQPTVVGRVRAGADGSLLGGGDLIATAAYAGDLHGNLWRFNLEGLANGFSGEGRSTLVFQARGPNDEIQPITAPVTLTGHPTGIGTLVLFGTGRYLGQPDVTDLSVQGFYGIWDQGEADPGPLVSRTGLLGQRFLETGIEVKDSDSGRLLALGRTSTANAIDWTSHRGWYLDLIVEGDAQGERVVSAPQLRADRVVFTSLIPEPDPCKAGGSSWVNALAFTSGGQLDTRPFDFDLSVASIRPTAGGIYSSPAAMALPGGQTLSFISSSAGDLIPLRESVLGGRVWHQIQ